MLVGDRDRGVAGERGLAGEQLEEHAAGGVDVAAGVHGLAAGLLRGQVLGGADHRGGLGDRCLPVGHRARDAEVHDLHRAVAGDHHVGGLDIPVHDPVPVAEVQCGADVGHDLHRALAGQWALGFDDVAQRSPVDELHHDVGQRAVVGAGLAGVVDGDDGRVVERGGVLRLPPEPFLELRVAGQVRAQHLHCHLAPEPDVATSVNLGHAAIAERFAQLIAV